MRGLYRVTQVLLFLIIKIQCLLVKIVGTLVVANFCESVGNGEVRFLYRRIMAG